MNCLEFRRRVLADPRRPGPDAEAHAAQCAECREFLSLTLAEEARLERALRIEAPEGLAGSRPGSRRRKADQSALAGARGERRGGDGGRPCDRLDAQ